MPASVWRFPLVNDACIGLRLVILSKAKELQEDATIENKRMNI